MDPRLRGDEEMGENVRKGNLTYALKSFMYTKYTVLSIQLFKTSTFKIKIYEKTSHC